MRPPQDNRLVRVQIINAAFPFHLPLSPDPRCSSFLAVSCSRYPFSRQSRSSSSITSDDFDRKITVRERGFSNIFKGFIEILSTDENSYKNDFIQHDYVILHVVGHDWNKFSDRRSHLACDLVDVQRYRSIRSNIRAYPSVTSASRKKEEISREEKNSNP